MKQLEPLTSAGDSVRLHIPRASRAIYDIRNKRDTGHLTDGIDANIQDASLVIAIIDWVMSELVRLHHDVSPAEAQDLIQEFSTRDVPMIEVFNGRPRLLADLRASDHVLALLYWSGAQGVGDAELATWLPASMRPNLRRTLRQLHEKHWVHYEDGRAQLTRPGERLVAERGLIHPI